MKFPSLLAGAGLLVLVYLLAKNVFDESTAFWAVLVCMASHHFGKLVWFARTDMVMVFGLYLAIYIVLCTNRPWLVKTLSVGFVMGLDYLAKGPAGPSLFAVWLLVWTYREGYFRRPKKWVGIIPGALVFIAIAGGWLLLVWDKPLFREVVLSEELAARVPGMAKKADPFYYYLPLLFVRIAPWTLLAIAALWNARKKPDWRNSQFLMWWALGMLILLSLVPEKRHDLLLPVYPPIFILAGLGIRYLTEPTVSNWLSWITWFFAAVLILLPPAALFLMKGVLTPWVWLMPAMAAMSGIVAVFIFKSRSKKAFIMVCLGLVIAHGLYHFGLGNNHPLHLYADLKEFTAPIRDASRNGEVLVWKTHPLISYELGIHRQDGNLEDLKNEKLKWLITEEPLAEKIIDATGWRLKEHSSFIKKERFAKINARLYAVEED